MEVQMAGPPLSIRRFHLCSRRWRHGAFLLVFLFTLLGFSVQPGATQTGSPVVLSMGTHALTVPWYPGPISNGFNPAFMVGTDHSIRSGDHWSFFYAVNVGFFRNQWWMTGISLEPELGIGRSLAGGFHADLRLGLGYMHYFWRRKTLEFNEGRYEESRSWGKPSLILPLSATLGYRGDSGDPLSVSPFVTARWGVQGMFLSEVPAMTHFLLLGGVRIERGQNDTGGGR